MIKTVILTNDSALTDADRQALEEGAKYPIIPDEDCPELTPENIHQFTILSDHPGGLGARKTKRA